MLPLARVAFPGLSLAHHVSVGGVAPSLLLLNLAYELFDHVHGGYFSFRLKKESLEDRLREAAHDISHEGFHAELELLSQGVSEQLIFVGQEGSHDLVENAEQLVLLALVSAYSLSLDKQKWSGLSLCLGLLLLFLLCPLSVEFHQRRGQDPLSQGLHYAPLDDVFAQLAIKVGEKVCKLGSINVVHHVKHEPQVVEKTVRSSLLSVELEVFECVEEIEEFEFGLIPLVKPASHNLFKSNCSCLECASFGIWHGIFVRFLVRACVALSLPLS